MKKRRKRKTSRDVDSKSLLGRQQKGRKTRRDWENGKNTEAGRLSGEPERQKKRQLKWR